MPYKYQNTNIEVKGVEKTPERVMQRQSVIKDRYYSEHALPY